MESRTITRKPLSTSLLVFLVLSWIFAFQPTGNLGSYALASDPTLKAVVDFDEVIGKNNLSLGTQIHGYDNFQGKPTLEQKAQIGFKIIRVFVTRDKTTEPCLSWNETSLTGVFDWSHIDPLVNSIFEVGAEPLLNVGAGKFPDIVVPPGMTANYLGSRFPDPLSFGSYVVAIIEHLKSIGRNVLYWEIWRTPEIRNSTGWIDPAIVANYTKFFNQIQYYIHNIEPNALVSSDRTFYRAFFDIFVRSAKRVGFLSYMKYDAYGTPYYRPEGYNSGDKIMQAAGVLDKPTGGSWAIYSPKEMQRKWLAYQGQVLPVVVVETNLNSAYEAGTDPRIQTPLGSAWYAEALRSFILDGTVSCSVYHRYCSDESYLWGPNRTTGWGLGMIRSSYPYEQWYPYWTNFLFGNYLRVGDRLYYTTVQNNTLISLLAWGNATHYFVALVGKTNNTFSVDLQLNSGQVDVQKTLRVYRIDMQYNGLYSTEVNYSIPIKLTLAGYSVNVVVVSRSQPEPSMVLFEDGFESTEFRDWTGTYASIDETESIVNNFSHHGDNSAMFISDGNEEIEYSYCYKTVPSSSEIDVRSYFYVATSGIVDDNDHFYMMSLKTENSTVAYAGWWKTGGLVKWCLVIRHGTDNVFSYSRSAPSSNRWYSVELRWKRSSTSGFGELWIDGTRVCSITGMNTAAFGDVKQIRVGLPGTYYSARTAVYVDCTKAATEFVGRELYQT